MQCRRDRHLHLRRDQVRGVARRHRRRHGPRRRPLHPAREFARAAEGLGSCRPPDPDCRSDSARPHGGPARRARCSPGRTATPPRPGRRRQPLRCRACSGTGARRRCGTRCARTGCASRGVVVAPQRDGRGTRLRAERVEPVAVARVPQRAGRRRRTRSRRRRRSRRVLRSVRAGDGPGGGSLSASRTPRGRGSSSRRPAATTAAIPSR